MRNQSQKEAVLNVQNMVLFVYRDHTQVNNNSTSYLPLNLPAAESASYA